MTPPPLCIIQARLNSARLPGKMLLTLGGETLIARAWRIACEAFGTNHCVVAIPKADEAGPLGDELRCMGARIFAWEQHVDLAPGYVSERDVLGRFYNCAHTYRWRPESVIVRYTPDDHRKDVDSLRRVAAGERLPVEMGGEAFTLEHLAARHLAVSGGEFLGRSDWREHITHALFPVDPPPTPPGVWSIDTERDYKAACEYLAGDPKPPSPPADRARYL